MCKSLCQVVDLLQTVVKLCQCDCQKIQQLNDLLGNTMAGVHAETSGGGSSCIEPAAANNDKDSSDRMDTIGDSKTLESGEQVNTDYSASSQTNLQEELNQLRSENHTLKESNSRLESEKNDLEKNNGNLHSQIDSLTVANNEFRDSEGLLKKEIEELRSNIISLTQNKAELESKNKNLTALNEELNNNCSVLQKEKEQLAGFKSVAEEELSRIRNENSRINKDLSASYKKNESLNAELKTVRNETALIKGKLAIVPKADKLFELAETIKNLPAVVRNSSFLKVFDLEDIVLLLNQCGNSVRLTNVWTTIHKKIVEEGTFSPELTEFMLKLVEIYNLSNEGTKLVIVNPKPGDSYSGELYSRVTGSNPVKIKEVLFPGLNNSAGKQLTKPVVR